MAKNGIIDFDEKNFITGQRNVLPLKQELSEADISSFLCQPKLRLLISNGRYLCRIATFGTVF